MKRARLTIAIESDGLPPHVTSWDLGPEGIDAVIRRAAGHSSPEWQFTCRGVFHEVERALVEWARKTLPRAAQSDADVLSIGLANAQKKRSCGHPIVVCGQCMQCGSEV